MLILIALYESVKLCECFLIILKRCLAVRVSIEIKLEFHFYKFECRNLLCKRSLELCAADSAVIHTILAVARAVLAVAYAVLAIAYAILAVAYAVLAVTYTVLAIANTVLAIA